MPLLVPALVLLPALDALPVLGAVPPELADLDEAAVFFAPDFAELPDFAAEPLFAEPEEALFFWAPPVAPAWLPEAPAPEVFALDASAPEAAAAFFPGPPPMPVISTSV